MTDALKLEHMTIKKTGTSHALIIPSSYFKNGLIKKESTYTILFIEEKPKEIEDGQPTTE